jgi:hypothetical protein
MQSKKQKKILKIAIPIIVITILIIGFLFFIKIFIAPAPISTSCTTGQKVEPYCDANGIMQKICDKGKWQPQLLDNCTDDSEMCAFGKCFNTSCTGLSEAYCLNDLELLTPYCGADNTLQLNRQVCGEKTPTTEIKGFCRDGKCWKVPPTCGNGICETTEDNVSCYRDCSSLNDAQAYAKEVQDNIEELRPFLQCNKDFDCDNPKVIAMSDYIMSSYNIPDNNPQMYMDAVVDYVNKYIAYDFEGGYSQCGESASSLIRTVQNSDGSTSISYLPGSSRGNCVDFSILTVSLMRVRKIPSAQKSGCVSRFGWFCYSYSVTKPQRLGSMPIIWSSPEQKAQADVVTSGEGILGHSWSTVWIGKNAGWVIYDSTVGQNIAKKCIGYHEVMTSDTIQHKDCDTTFSTECFTEAWCHLSGDSVLSLCSSY